MSFAVATTAHTAARPMVGQAVVCACVAIIAKQGERTNGRPDTGPGGSHQE